MKTVPGEDRAYLVSLAHWVDYLGYTGMRCGIIPYGGEGQTIRDIGTLGDALDVHLSEVHRLLDSFDET